MQDTERARFITAAVPGTRCPVSAAVRQQRAARLLISRGWIGYGDEQIVEIARPHRSANGGRLWGAIVREKVPA